MLAYLILMFPIFFTKNFQKYKAHQEAIRALDEKANKAEEHLKEEEAVAKEEKKEAPKSIYSIVPSEDGFDVVGPEGVLTTHETQESAEKSIKEREKRDKQAKPKKDLDDLSFDELTDMVTDIMDYKFNITLNQDNLSVIANVLTDEKAEAIRDSLSEEELAVLHRFVEMYNEVLLEQTEPPKSAQLRDLLEEEKQTLRPLENELLEAEMLLEQLENEQNKEPITPDDLQSLKDRIEELKNEIDKVKTRYAERRKEITQGTPKEVSTVSESEVELKAAIGDRKNIIYKGESVGYVEIPTDLEGDTYSLGDINIKPEFRNK